MSSPATKKAGIMGWPVGHSLSPRLHGYWLKEHNIDGSYVPLAVEPEKLRNRLKALPADGFCGVNLTIPHKEEALRFMDHADPLALRVGAVNTVIVADGRIEGRNTDVYGFTQNLLSAGYKRGNRPVTVIGAGGAARAAVVALLDMGAKDIRIINRTRDRALSVAASFGEAISVYVWDDKRALKNTSLLVNATSLGLKGQPPLDIALDELPPDAYVTDMVYVPLMTDFLKRAEARGNKTVDGLGMLLHQAVPAFTAFFGVKPQVTPALRSYVLEGRP